ncbi:MAG: Ig-like domain-containing protein [Bacteroidales bacterium]|nr:Ig-like domain-containing protein [Bacteroidales bacterium]
MKLKNVFLFLALAAGMMVGCVPPEKGKSYLDTETKDLLTVSPTAKKIAEDGTASFTFSLSIIFPNGKAVDFENNQATLSFSATNGSVSPSSATTDAKGQVTVTFTTTDAQNFEGGTVTGVVKKVEGKDLYQQGNLATATAQVLPLNAEEPVDVQPIKKALELCDNTYSIQKAGEAAQVFNFPQQFSKWYEGAQAISVECMDEDENDYTKGTLNGEIAPEVANKLTTISQEFYEKYPWAAVKLGTSRLDKTIDAHFGQGGNVKLDGSSQIWLKEKSGTKAYSGQYQLLFVFVFQNWTYDPETDSYILDGDEYTICGNATLDELVAELSDFRLDYPSNWVAPGQSITLTASWTPGAKFDWSKVTLNSQTRNYYSGEWFSWDASTQKLTATKSAENQQVELTFGYKDTDMTYNLSLYNGPGYSSFSLSMDNSSADYILVDGSAYEYIDLTAENWTPEGSSFNGYGIEIDPATENYKKLYYNPSGKYVQFKKGIAEGEFNLIFRSKTDHNAKFTIPVKVVHQKPTSFQITYKHSNNVFGPWTSGGENGICYYEMGMEVGVITEPKDAYWNWADVELAYDYDGFAFNGWGGRDDHPKLQRTKSNPGGETTYGTQIIFRLKYNHKKRSEIVVDHN